MGQQGWVYGELSVHDGASLEIELNGNHQDDGARSLRARVFEAALVRREPDASFEDDLKVSIAI